MTQIKKKKSLADKSTLEVATILYQTAVDTKAEDIVLMDVSKVSGFADYFLIMSGRSTRHVQGLATALDEKMSRKRISNLKAEGLDEGHWVLLDFDDIIVHIFYYEERPVYDLEGLWHDAPRIDVAKLGGKEEGRP